MEVGKPIVKAADTLKDISEGDGGLTRIITINSKNEIDDQSKTIGMMLRKISVSIREISYSTEISSKNREGIGALTGEVLRFKAV